MTHVARWLEQHGLGKYADLFAKNDVDMNVLPQLTEEHLEKLGVSLGHRIRLLKAIEELSESPRRAETQSRTPTTEVSVPRVVTPEHLAEKILAARSTLEGERKLVTILFADIKGSTELIEQLDPEQASQLLNPALQRMMDAVHHCEGTVNRVQGDGLMAIFGAPLAHEDHAVLACYAALAMQQAIHALSVNDSERTIEIRVGLHSGEVVVQAINNDLSMSYDAVGKTVHLAARMEQQAPPGGIRLTADTARLAEGMVVTSAKGPSWLKGVSDVVEVYALEGVTSARTRWQAALARGLSRFVGRKRSLQSLTEALEQARRGRGQIAAIVGEAGVGKSRLVYEFVQSPSARDWQVLGGHSVSYGKVSDWLPVSFLLRDYFGIADDDSPRAQIDKVNVKLARLHAALQAELPAFLALLDVSEDDPGWATLSALQRRRRTLNAVQALLVQESQRQPLLLIFEDLHWIDGETQTLLDELVARLPSHRILLLVDYRPGYSHGWSQRSYYAQVRLDPFSPTDSEALLDALVGDGTGLKSLKDLLIERADGNPLYLEEIVKALVESGALLGEPGACHLGRDLDSIALPATIQAIIAERIDRLKPEFKQLLQAAAVVGSRVTQPLLRTVAEASDDRLRRGLSVLQEAELLYQSQLFPEHEYTFKHAHIQEVAYRGLLQAQRRGLHARVAQALQGLYPGRRTELAEKLAVHLERGERWREAAEAYSLAAQKGKTKFTYASALAHAQNALRMWQKTPGQFQQHAQAQAVLGDLASLQGDLEKANEAYERALQLATDERSRQSITNRIHQRHFARRENAKIAYYVHGSGSETLLFVQPNAYRVAMFQPLVDALCQEFRVVTFDPMGTGASDPASDAYPRRRRVEDIRAVIESLGRDPVVGIGLSKAGAYLLRLARSYPHLLVKLVTVGSPTDPDKERPWPEKSHRQEQAIVRGDYSELEEFITDFAHRIFPEPEACDLAQAYIRTSLQLPPAVFRSFLADGLTDPDRRVVSVLGEIEIPILAMHGTADRQISFSASSTIVAHAPDAQLYAFEGKGHQPYLTATNEFCEVLRQFVLTGAVPEPATGDS